MKLKLKNIRGEEVKGLDFSGQLKGFDKNYGSVRQAVLAEMTNLRQGSHSSKNRSAVRGGGKKPFKQKGRGAARAGTIRSPLWKGGGVVFGPSPHSYNVRLPKKMKRLARLSVVVEKLENKQVIIVDNFDLDSHKTSSLINVFKTLKIEQKKISLLLEEPSMNLSMAVRNLSNVYMVKASNVSVYELIDCEMVISDQMSFSLLIDMLVK
tara:strand:- start:316 stop:942 length:627 start_codon:yes stop_codon:yes gene_type:complete